ncbi:MAG: asparagine synthase (glutamine-hydrolyzing) [Planctomycetota bacterium]
MCGIAGLFHRSSQSAEQLHRIIDGMTSVLRHRGPDSDGSWLDASQGVAFGHTRLAVVDLSPSGHQPMASSSERYQISFNGEIYNHLDIRSEIEEQGVRVRGKADTAVILGAIEVWGLETTLSKLRGMFAFGVWDRRDRTLHLARDRMGEKPLYFGWIGGQFVFASELKSLRAHPDWDQTIDRAVLASYMRLAYVPAPHSIYGGIYKLFPGTSLSLTAADDGAQPQFSPWPDDPHAELSPKTYWSASHSARQGLGSQATDSNAAEQQLDVLLRDAVSEQMISDVPLGAFLSGGVDSTTVVALMQELSRQRVRTFTIGFDIPGFNEAEYAAEVARYLETDHTELYLSANDAMDVVASLPTVFDEPHADSSQIPAILVSKLARQHVTVSLSGDGGDELFGGYNRYLHSQKLWRYMRPFPTICRRSLAGVLSRVPPSSWDSWFRYSPKRLPRMGYKIHKLADAISASDQEEVYRNLISYWPRPETLVIDSKERASMFHPRHRLNDSDSFFRQMLYWDQIAYLPDDNLAKMDRASMSVGLETRAPLLDHRIVDFSWSLPEHMKVHGGQSKWLLRQVLYRYVPKQLIERPKMGFSVPVGEWLRGSLRPWADELLSNEHLVSVGLLDSVAVRRVWSDHLAGKIEGQNQLWAVLMFLAWFREHEH